MRLLIVANRLPFTLSFHQGTLITKTSSGGLVSGLLSYLHRLPPDQRNYVWVGWPGREFKQTDTEEWKAGGLEPETIVPVLLTKELERHFYAGFCNKTIWPLFHYFSGIVEYKPEYWRAYQTVNELFARQIATTYQTGDLVLIQDYHLMLVPRMLRQLKPDAAMAFFLHIPFPTYEVYRLLPKMWRQEILEGLLGADLVGFHTHDYAHYFQRCVLRILGYEHFLGNIQAEHHLVKTGAFAFGIDVENFERLAQTKTVLKEKSKLDDTLQGYKVILSIDRLDYTKGIINRLQAYELFLSQNPAYRKKVVLMLILIPSRYEVDQYRLMKRNIDEYIGRINGTFGAVDWTPIRYMYTSIPMRRLVALYSRSDVALITPIRDGMNLIAKEYVASRSDQSGVLILSEMTGAAQELNEAILINPNSREEMAVAIKTAIEMPLYEQRERNILMQQKLKKYSIDRWATDIIRSVSEIKEEQRWLESKMMSAATLKQLKKQFMKATRRLLLLDYDGTLVPFAKRPELAKPTMGLRRLLTTLSSDTTTTIAIVSGRSKDSLAEWLGDYPLILVAENGAWMRGKSGEWQVAQRFQTDWKESVKQVFSRYVERLSGSFIEEKEFSLVWHYREAETVTGLEMARELMHELVDFTLNKNLRILPGSKVIEVKNSGIDKGTVTQHLLSQEHYDFVLAIGDDRTDEDMFAVLPFGTSIKVGMGETQAQYSVSAQKEVIGILKTITSSD